MAITKVTSGVRTLGAGEVATANMAVDPTNASNLSSGSVPSAQLGNAPATDLTPVRNDIATLALHSAIADNKAAHNLSNAFIDQFEDDTGLDVQTTADRGEVEEYMGSIVEQDKTYGYNDGISIGYSFSGNGGITGSYLEDNNTGGSWGMTGHNSGQTATFDLQSSIKLTGINVYWGYRGGMVNNWQLWHSADNSSFTQITGTASGITSGGGNNFANGASHTAWGGATFSAATTARYWRLNFISHGGDGDWGISEIQWPGKELIVNASGNFTSATQTALASVSTMGIIVLYKNYAGTATLNTDIVAQVSADGGTNYSNATLVAGGTFSTGINIAAVSGVSVTAGTTPKYKISFANQASGTKETQVHGVALLY
jgi:hypothetical protein